MTINFRELFPAADPVLQGLANIPIIHHINETVWIFALIETGHLLLLTVLGGSVLALNLRILGVALTGITVKDVERAIRPWYSIGVWGTVGTGVAMGITTARTLLPSSAFFIKMIALVAAIILSNIVAREVRNDTPRTSREGLTYLSFALILWISALALFVTTAGLNSGGLLIAIAGAALLSVAAQKRHRPAVVALSVGAVAGWYALLDRVGGADSGTLAWVGHSALAAVAIAPVLSVGVREANSGVDQRAVTLRLTAFAATLAWVTVAAAGRWIGFS